MKNQTISPAKDKYKVSNWSKYNENLCRRGSLKLWLDEEVLEEWQELKSAKKVVGERFYPDSVILCCLILSMQYGQKLRQTTGFVESLFVLMGYKDMVIPDYTTLCRRKKDLPVEVSNRLKKGENINVSIDSTGLKVYGEGEWKVRKYGAGKRRTWRKLHIAIDADSQEIIDIKLTYNDMDDAIVATEMLQDKVEKISVVYGDGAYDDFKFRKILGVRIKQIIPPPKDAVEHLPKPRKKEDIAYLEQRNQAVKFINKSSRKEWKIQNGYHRRSLSETGMLRYKLSFTDKLSAREFKRQNTEVKIGAKILNTYIKVGMPCSEKV